jgi:purine-nucleoside phosphorylase
MMNRIQQAYDYVAERLGAPPKVGMILGSGIGHYGDTLQHAVHIPYAEIPSFPVSTVIGHDSMFVAGYKKGVPVILMKGRFHCYEGYSAQEVVMPVRVMKRLGVESLIVTNAAGGIHDDWEPGVLMAITDHINLSGFNPLRGANLEEFGTRFPDMSQCYDPEYIKALKQCAARVGIALKEGVYAMMSGPNFETPAEINMLKTLGADAVGMSTVPEVIAARHSGMRVCGVSCITNYAAGISKTALSHEEVFETASRVKNEFTRMFDLFFEGMA